VTHNDAVMIARAISFGLAGIVFAIIGVSVAVSRLRKSVEQASLDQQISLTRIGDIIEVSGL
jgi:hypothetical protein